MSSLAFSKRKPAKKPRKRPTKGGGEKGLQYRCQQWLVKSGLWERLLIFHVPNERKGSIGAAVHFKRMGVLPGAPDYLAIVRNRSDAIELKEGSGEQGPDQIRFQRRWERAGHRYHVVRTLEEFQCVVNALNMFS